jgi:hypothetical protein
MAAFLNLQDGDIFNTADTARSLSSKTAVFLNLQDGGKFKIEIWWLCGIFEF